MNQEIVQEVYVALTKGVTGVEMPEYLTKKTGKVFTEEETSLFIQEANKLFRRIVEEDKDAELGKGITRLNMLFEKTLKIQDYKACLAIQKEINVLLSLKKETEPEPLPNISEGYE